ncbi:hypothetical protein PIB30_070859 [Stylosanthes scabra]|uniref:Uncharacterized protein n=1 Tax=Stylosanthes scabra TaxID=79078 RepID=A0ABU6UN12_9FABA|nr:hypothetical protein [Stylosanthes scabra]
MIMATASGRTAKLQTFNGTVREGDGTGLKRTGDRDGATTLLRRWKVAGVGEDEKSGRRHHEKTGWRWWWRSGTLGEWLESGRGVGEWRRCDL